MSRGAALDIKLITLSMSCLHSRIPLVSRYCATTADTATATTTTTAVVAVWLTSIHRMDAPELAFLRSSPARPGKSCWVWVMWAFDFIFSRRSRVLTCTERFIFYSSHACLYNLGQRALSSSEETTTRKQTTATKQERLVVGRRLR